MTQISLASTPADENQDENEEEEEEEEEGEEEEGSSDPVEENDKNEQLPTLPTRTLHPSVYRRHMSESQVDLEGTSNGEFKLKVRGKRLLNILSHIRFFSSFLLGYSEEFNEISFVFGIIQ